MFAFKFATLLAVASSVVALPAPGSGECSTGKLQCCDSISPANSSDNASLDGLIPINLQSLGVPLGVNCLPVSVLSLSSAGTCNTQAACCSNIDNSGVAPIGVDCSPINVGL